MITCWILHRNDLLNEEGTWKYLSNFSNCIENKSEWICKFRIWSYIFQTLCRFRFFKCKYVNIHTITSFAIYTGYANAIDQRFNFSYRNLVDKRFVNNVIKMLSKVIKNEFNMDSWLAWQYIYKICLINLRQNLTINFWTISFVMMSICVNGKKETQSCCLQICHVNQTSKHLIFECDNEVQIWNALGFCFR